MGKSRLWLVVGSTLALLASTPAVAAAQTVTGSWATKWFVEFESPPAADGTSAATLTRERDRFRDAARASGVSYRRALRIHHAVQRRLGLGRRRRGGPSCATSTA